MWISYDSIIFDVLKLEDWSREFIYSEDKTTFLFIRHKLVVTCLLNVEATAASRFPTLTRIPGNRRPEDPLPGPTSNEILRTSNEDRLATGERRDNRLQNNGWWGAFESLLPDAARRLIDAARRGQNEVRTTKPVTIGTPRTDLNDVLDTNGAAEGGIFGGGLGSAAAGLVQPIGPPPGSAGGSVTFGGGTGPTFGGGGDFGGQQPATGGGSVVFGGAKPRKPFQGGGDFKGGGQKAGATDDFASLTVREERGRIRGTVPWSDVALRERLRQPRRQLLAWLFSGPVGDPEFMLVSPQPGCASDAQHGPVCTLLDVPEVHGQVSAVMRLQFETWEAPPLEFAATITTGGQSIVPGWNIARPQVRREQAGRKILLSTPALISHRWEMSFGWNPETHLRTQTIEGEGIFRMDVVRLRNLTADRLRRQLRHPVPEGYVRRPEQEGDVTLSPGGDGVKYRITDDQVLMNNPGGALYGVIHMDVEQGVDYSGYDTNFEHMPRALIDLG